MGVFKLIIVFEAYVILLSLLLGFSFLYES